MKKVVEMINGGVFIKLATFSKAKLYRAGLTHKQIKQPLEAQ